MHVHIKQQKLNLPKLDDDAHTLFCQMGNISTHRLYDKKKTYV